VEVNQTQLANILGITGRRVRQLKEEGLFQQQEKGKKYDLEACVQEYIMYKVKAEMGKGASKDVNVIKAEHESIKKDISKLKLRKMKKELHEAKDVEYFLGNMLVNFKNKLLSVPSKVAVQIIGEEDVNRITELLKREMIEALEELSEYDPDEINGDDEIDEQEEEEDEYE